MRIIFLMFLQALLLQGCGSVQGVDTAVPPEPIPAGIQPAITTESFQQNDTDCPKTKPPKPAFIPPDPGLVSHPNQFWFGSDALWTSLPVPGEWNDLPRNSEGYSQKIFWWSEGYSWVDETKPALKVKGKLLTMPGTEIETSATTHAFASDIGPAMLVGMEFPAAGCWELTGIYKTEILRFVIQINP